MAMRICLLAGVLLLSACSSVTLAPISAQSGAPNDRQQRSFYLFGWVGDHAVALDQGCPTQRVQQIRAYRSLSDTALMIASLGLYAPLTLDTWCTPKAEAQL